MPILAAFRVTTAAGLAGAIVLVGLGFGAVVSRVEAAELVMFRAQSCAWCTAWDREVGVIYDQTEEGRAAPVRMVDIDAPLPADIDGLGPARFTPTFVVVAEDREVGRILGYPGEDHFWGLLGALLAEAEQPHAGDRTVERTIQ